MQRLSTGITGFDNLIAGGFPAGSIIALRGAPGTGKTTAGLQFLKAGAEQAGEAGLYITFEELPEQLYADAAELGWDLKALEQRQLLRVLSTSPEVFLDALQDPYSFLMRVAKPVRRIVIDSVTLFEHIRSDDDLRGQLYRLRSALKRLGLTAVLIEERDPHDEVTTLAFLADGVINVSFEEKATGHRIREVEVLKLRGSSIATGRHLFRIGHGGISVYPALTTHDILPLDGPFIATAIPKLDALLGGGIPLGATVLLDANSRADYRVLAAAILTPFLQQRHGLALAVGPSTFPAAQQQRLVKRLAIDFERLAAEQRLCLVDDSRVELPDWVEPSVIRLANMLDADHHAATQQFIRTRREHADDPGWVWFRDLNAVIAVHGEDYLWRYFVEQQGLCQAQGVTALCLVNGSEVKPTLLAKLQRGATVVLKTWVDGRYQYFEVLKSPTGRVSEPFLLQYSTDAPFVDLR